MSGSALDTRAYWENRLSARLDLRGTGHRSFSLDYNRWLYLAQQSAIQSLLCANDVDLAGRSVLDVGSGTGFYVQLFLDAGASPVMGMDITEASAVYLQRTFPHSQFLAANIAARYLPVTHEFDLVSAVSVLYHILDEREFTRALSNLCSHVASDGYLLVSDTFAHPLLPVARHARFRTLDRYRAILETHRLSVLAVAPMYYLLNRAFIPFLGPKLIDVLQLGNALYNLDRRLQEMKLGNGNGMKFMLARKGT